MADTAMAEPTQYADMWFDGPARQRRWTVLFRLVLLIPQFFVVVFLFVAMLIVGVVGWFAALLTGRLPQWAHAFIGGVIRWQTRVQAFYYLLTDRYPPFRLADEAYPLRPVLPENGRLNRWAVLFRFILAIPAQFFLMIVSYGLGLPLLLVAWLIVLCSGRMPAALYWAYAAIVRYGFRLNAYFFMLTPEYPSGMFGDPAPLAVAWAQAAPPVPSPSDLPDRRLLVLPPAARGWLVFATVWGTVLLFGVSALNAALTNKTNSTNTRFNTVSIDYNNSVAAISVTTRCATLSCLHARQVDLANALGRFDDDLVQMQSSLPPRAAASSSAVLGDLSQLSTAFTALANSVNEEAYRSNVQTSHVDILLLAFHNDSHNLLSALSHSAA